MSDPALAADRIAFHYRRDRPVLREVSLRLEPGTVTALAGPNGAGKTTLLRLLLGLARPAAGRATLAGQDVADLPHRHRAARLGYLPQRPAVAFAFTAREVVRMGRYPASGRREGDDRVVSGSLERVGLLDRADEPVGALSAGQQQRVSLARALAQLAGAPAPAFLLADEPVAALDPRHALETMGLFRALAGAGLGILVVLHDLTQAARFADRGVLLDASGRLAASGPIDDAFDPARLQAVYGVPFTRVGSGVTGAIIPLPAADAARN